MSTLSPAAGLYVGLDRFEVRRRIVDDLAAAGLIEKVEDYENKVGYSERNADTVVEPRLSSQWFMKMKGMAVPALEAVEDDTIKFVPEKFKNIYRHWMEDVHDWCISRQLWWGHRIPAWYLPDGSVVVAETAEEALEEARRKDPALTAADLEQDPDVLDTWFSSWLWPIALFNGILDPDNKEISYYYPTATLVTGPDIIFFWVSRMIMAGYEFRKEPPFKNVYFTGIVRDEIGRKMSKQLGNSPDPLDLIATYGADGVRMGLMLSAPAGSDILFDKKLCETGRNFCNKIWNAFRLVKGWEVDPAAEQPRAAAEAIEWFDSKLSATIAELDDLFSKFRISEALMAVYRLFWDEFSSWYLEAVKPAWQTPVDAKTLAAVERHFDALLRLLHPFMPFITEELWQNLAERREGESIMYAAEPRGQEPDAGVLEKMETVKAIVNGVRGVRAKRNIAPKEALELHVVGDQTTPWPELIGKLGNVSAIANVGEADATAAKFIAGTTTYEVPLADMIDTEAERAKLAKEIDYLNGFKASIEKKLSNERFVAKAPAAVVEGERKKLADAEAKIARLTDSLQALS